MTNYYKKLTEHKDLLEKHPLLNLHHYEIGIGLSRANIKMIEADYDIHIPESIKEVYENVGSVDFLWTLKEESQILLIDNDSAGSVNGKAYIPDLNTVFGGFDSNKEDGWKNIFWFPDSMDKNILEENRKVRPIDFYDNNSGKCVCILEEESKSIKDNLYLRTSDGKVLPFGLTVDQYLDLMIKMNGYLNFQTAFMVKESYECNKLKYYFPKLFPGVDLKEFE